jgi:hypothetical protein
MSTTARTAKPHNSILKDLVIWLVGPAMLIMALIGGIELVHDMATYTNVVTGTAIAANCTASPSEMFNACVSLDTTQIEDLR